MGKPTIELVQGVTEDFDNPKTSVVFEGDVETLLDNLPDAQLFDLVVTSPPYNIGKSYEDAMTLDEYTAWQERVISKIVPRVRDGGSICWQVGNYISGGVILPLDYIFHPIFSRFPDLRLRNRIVWHFRHGLHARNRLSGRYEVILWYTKGHDDYVFNLDEIRVPSRYPGKRHFKGPNKGELSGNRKGKNPEDLWDFSFDELDLVWDIPNVKGNHVEKTDHPCQFPVGLVVRLVKGMSPPGGLVFDPFAGTGTTGAAAVMNSRRFWGAEIVPQYAELSVARIQQAIDGSLRVRDPNQPIYDPSQSPLSRVPKEWE